MAIAFAGLVYRALNPVYAQEPLSGRGAALYGGRFNPKGVPALYVSLAVMTAVREANQVGSLQPTTLVAYEADFEAIFDGRDAEALAAEGVDPAVLAATTWRDEMRTSGEARTQALAHRLIASGHAGMLVRSFAPGNGPDDVNLVLWTWGAAPPTRLVPIDDEGRLLR
ncbi:RES family NAD+ phosphorylase [Oharaeibacter diazotrophicus]|uniref:RES domain-containing protein n=1 Tax=Oharaeibacter diazotrophicus TaxID=1920512 RepID=A0A4R6RAU3_9HYPH|nr:RES domain-containing protein [Oharaeibacter diazotrophicus]TDP83233.1 RES domain-containing protein [Oharaeibacter diazotrophicus]BBE72066.1 RES domain protein [Pleomorphomonas sp. SM30]GLS78831.1 hypothetical protein GCM10007904_41680 [Oharaeibacter diazotrophicus]